MIDFLILVPEIAALNYACSIYYNRCCLSKSHALVIKRKLHYAVKRHWLSRLLRKIAQGGFSTCWIQICHQIGSLTTPAIQDVCTQYEGEFMHACCLYIITDSLQLITRHRKILWKHWLTIWGMAHCRVVWLYFQIMEFLIAGNQEFPPKWPQKSILKH